MEKVEAKSRLMKELLTKDPRSMLEAMVVNEAIRTAIASLGPTLHNGPTMLALLTAAVELAATMKKAPLDAHIIDMKLAIDDLVMVHLSE